MMDNSIQIPLDLPDVRVLEVSKTEEGFWLIRVESTLSGTLLSPSHILSQKRSQMGSIGHCYPLLELLQPASRGRRVSFPRSIQGRFYSSSELPASQAHASIKQARSWSYCASTGRTASTVRL